MKLNQIIAIEKGVKGRAHTFISGVYKLVQKPALFNGAIRTYHKRNEEGDDVPGERQLVQYTVAETLEHLKQSQSEMLDILATKDMANQEASADVVVSGRTILDAVPATTLISLEKVLTDYRTLFNSLPVLDPSEDWSVDVSTGQYKSSPKQTQRTKKVQRPIVLYDATDKHPAQTNMITEDVVVGNYETVLLSGAIPKGVRNGYIQRIDMLIDAVKQAREEANSREVSRRPKIGGKVFDFILGSPQD